jgi:hypothetical protein
MDMCLECPDLASDIVENLNYALASSKQILYTLQNMQDYSCINQLQFVPYKTETDFPEVLSEVNQMFTTI